MLSVVGTVLQPLHHRFVPGFHPYLGSLVRWPLNSEATKQKLFLTLG
jgi:hypothetical protein